MSSGWGNWNPWLRAAVVAALNSVVWYGVIRRTADPFGVELGTMAAEACTVLLLVALRIGAVIWRLMKRPDHATGAIVSAAALYVATVMTFGLMRLPGGWPSVVLLSRYAMVFGAIPFLYLIFCEKKPNGR